MYRGKNFIIGGHKMSDLFIKNALTDDDFDKINSYTITSLSFDIPLLKSVSFFRETIEKIKNYSNIYIYLHINDKIELELLHHLYNLKNISFNIKVRNKLPKIAESYDFDFVNIENSRSIEILKYINSTKRLRICGKKLDNKKLLLPEKIIELEIIGTYNYLYTLQSKTLEKIILRGGSTSNLNGLNNFPKLRELTLYDIRNFDEKYLLPINELQNLKKLVLSYLPKIRTLKMIKLPHTEIVTYSMANLTR